jgi:hypothetical protein
METKPKSTLQRMAYLLGAALVFAILQFSISNVQIIHKFVVSKVNTQDDLENLAEDVKVYLVIAIIWTIATMLILYEEYGNLGILFGFVTNFIIIMWIYLSYRHAVRTAIKKHDLQSISIF